jgi:hypothetical protein
MRMHGCYGQHVLPSCLSIAESIRLSYDGRQRIVITSGAALRCLVQDTTWR